MNTAPPVALVTGASSGIGRATALALVDAGFAVVGTSRNAANAEPLAGVTFLDLDVASDESVRSLVEEVIERFGRIDVLVNNAGVGAVGAGEESSINQTKEVFDINVFGLMRMTNAVLPHMRTQGSGRVVNVSSVLGLIPAPFTAIYAATKHAIEGYSESVDHELREHGVRMLLIAPAYTSTSFEASSQAPDPMVMKAAARSPASGSSRTTRAMSDSTPPTIAPVAPTLVSMQPRASHHAIPPAMTSTSASTTAPQIQASTRHRLPPTGTARKGTLHAVGRAPDAPSRPLRDRAHSRAARA